MADEAAAPAANDTSTPAPGGSVSDIANFLTERRAKQTSEPATPDGAGADEQVSSQEEYAAADDNQPPGETDETDPAGEPPISPPKSWTKAEKEAFASLPREHQQAIADRESERESYYRRGHDEAAQKGRAAEQARQAAEQARQQYEQALPSLLQQFQSQFNAEFHDIKSWEDAEAMQENDPLRFQRWTLAREKGQTLQREAAAAQHRQQQEQRANWEKFVADEDAAFLEKAPEFKDAKRAAELAGEANAMMVELGFSQEEMSHLWNGGGGISLRDHRIQLALHKAVLYDRAKKAVKTAQPKPVPPVQRPGIAQSKGTVSESHIRELANKARNGATRDVAALIAAKRQAKAS